MCPKQKHCMYLLSAGVPYTLYFGAYKALASKRCPSIHCALYAVGMHCPSAQGINIADKRQEGYSKGVCVCVRKWDPE